MDLSDLIVFLWLQICRACKSSYFIIKNILINILYQMINYFNSYMLNNCINV